MLLGVDGVLLCVCGVVFLFVVVFYSLLFLFVVFSEEFLMSGRVLSTDSAKQSIQRMQQIIGGGLLEQISALDGEGRNLSLPEVWDGLLAGQFRGDVWPSTQRALMDAQQALDELRSKISIINTNIMTAGGNA